MKRPRGGFVTALSASPPAELETRILASFAYWPKVGRLIEVIEEALSSKLTLDLFLDSGAFTALSKGIKITTTQYAEWVSALLPYARVFANLDVIGDADATFKNQLDLEDRLGAAPMPVYHAATRFEHLERYLNAGYKYLALGGMADRTRKQPIQWTIHSFRLAEAAGARLHGFGISDAKIIKLFPWESVDSSGWLSGERFACVSLFNTRHGKFSRVQLKPSNINQLFRGSHQARAVGVQLKTIGDAKPGQKFVREQRIAMARINIESTVKLEAFSRQLHRDRMLRLYLVAGNQLQFRDVCETYRRIIEHQSRRAGEHISA